MTKSKEIPTKIKIDDLEVIFPYSIPYPEQTEYMTQIKLSLDGKGIALLEMPSGTGKTVCLMSVILSYMEKKRNEKVDIGPLVYCTRTINEMEQGIRELKNLIKIRQEMDPESEFNKNFLGISMTRRSNYCISEYAVDMENQNDYDALCAALTIHSSERSCQYYEHPLLRPKPGVYSLNELRTFGSVNVCCPYFLARRLLSEADVVLCSFAYTIDSGASEILYKSITDNAICVFDEAHNIDDVCCEFYSVSLGKATLEKASNAIHRAKQYGDDLRERERKKIRQSLENVRSLLDLEENEGFYMNPDMYSQSIDAFRRNVIPDDVIQERIPKSLLEFDSFIKISLNIVKYLAEIINNQESLEDEENVTFAEEATSDDLLDDFEITDINVKQHSPVKAFEKMLRKLNLEKKEVIFLVERLQRFLTKFRAPNFEKYVPLIETLQFAQMMGGFEVGFTVFVEHTLKFGTVIQLNCVDSTIAFKPVKKNFKRIIITSGTLSPLEFYHRLLDINPISSQDFSMSFARKCLCPIIVSKGFMNCKVTSQYKERKNENVAISHGKILLDAAKSSPDGIVAFAPSYLYLDTLISVWKKHGILDQVYKYKCVFRETPSAAETAESLAKYKYTVDTGRGAILLGVARGRVSEGIDFSDHYGRVCILFGLPLRNTQSANVQQRAQYLELTRGINTSQFFIFDAMRAASQCVGRLLRSKKDYGLVIYCDNRFGNERALSLFPKWVRAFLEKETTNISYDYIADISTEFFTRMGQPFSLEVDKLKNTDELFIKSHK